MTSNLNLCTLQFAYQESPWEANLTTILDGLKASKQFSLTLAPELALTGYSYEKMDEAADFSKAALEKIVDATDKKAFGFTAIVKVDKGFVNRFYFISDKKIIYTQDKAKLFALGDEPKYFIAGDEKLICPFNWNGLKVGVLICFELRFVELWLQLRGCDLILVPALWGKSRKSHFETLNKALAIANQCFVLSSNSADLNMAAGGGVADPFGVIYQDDKKRIFTCKADLERVKKMRRYIKGVINE